VNSAWGFKIAVGNQAEDLEHDACSDQRRISRLIVGWRDLDDIAADEREPTQPGVDRRAGIDALHRSSVTM
jgi:hypothetical protein